MKAAFAGKAARIVLDERPVSGNRLIDAENSEDAEFVLGAGNLFRWQSTGLLSVIVQKKRVWPVWNARRPRLYGGDRQEVGPSAGQVGTKIPAKSEGCKNLKAS